MFLLNISFNLWCFEKPGHNTKMNRWHKVIWFNPPLIRNIKTNIGKTFLRLVKQHFSKHHKLNEIFIKNTLKLSYCCMKSMSSIIKQHSIRILSAESNANHSCNCRNKEYCPLEEYCLNKRTEIISKSRHRNIYLIKMLSNVVLDL